MRRNRSSDFIPLVRTPPARRGLPQQAARTDAPVTSEPRVLHHPNEVTALLHNEDLSSCHLSLRLDAPLDTATCKDLTQLLERADVHLDELSLTLSDSLEADALAALLAAAEAHRDSLAPAGFQLQGTGVPLPDSLRLVIAGSRLCLELGALTVRPLLFGHHLQRSEERASAGDGTLDALQNFLQCSVTLLDSEHDLLESISHLAQKTNDFALMRTCSVLLPGSEVELCALPETQLYTFLAQWKIPYRLNLRLWSAPQVDALARWLRYPRPLFQGIRLYGFPEVDYWQLIFARLVTQPDLQGVLIMLTPFDEKLPFLPNASAPTPRRLPHLLVKSNSSRYGGTSVSHALFVVELTRYLNPVNLVLNMETQKNIEQVIDELKRESPILLFRLIGLHLGWTEDMGFSSTEEGLTRMFSCITVTGMRCLNADPPDSDSKRRARVHKSAGENLQLSLRPGPTYGLTDSTKAHSTLHFHRHWREDSLHGAAEATLQELLRQNDHDQGQGEDSLARQLIKEFPFSPRDLNAMARVSRNSHRGGQVAAILWVMQNLPVDVPTLREWFQLPSGELDDKLVKAMRAKLENTSKFEPMLPLFLAATAPQSV